MATVLLWITLGISNTGGLQAPSTTPVQWLRGAVQQSLQALDANACGREDLGPNRNPLTANPTLILHPEPLNH